MSKLAWSWSRIELFEQCPKRFYHKTIKKDIPFIPNDATERGKRVHDSLANALLHGSALPAELSHMVSLINGVNQRRRANPDIHTIIEQDLAFREDLTLTDWFSKEVWLRMRWDLALKEGREISIWDWKTGKVKPASDQLALSAFGAFAIFPDLEIAKTAYVWVDHSQFTPVAFTRDQFDRLERKFGDRAELLQIANEKGEWPAKANPYCKWCELTKLQCMHHP